MKEITQIKADSWIKFVIYGFLFLSIYYSAFTFLVTVDWNKEGYSYCWLILPIVIFLIWMKRDRVSIFTFKSLLGQVCCRLVLGSAFIGWENWAESIILCIFLPG